MKKLLKSLVFVGVFVFSSCYRPIQFQDRSVAVCLQKCVNSSLISNDNATQIITLTSDDSTVATVVPHFVNVSIEKKWMIKVCGNNEPGFTTINANGENKQDRGAHLHVVVSKIWILKWLSDVIGWGYFFAWSISYYPQIYTNYVRQSVIGLNFDFLALNIVGFILYSMYNCGMYYNAFIKEEYFAQYPRGLNPVMFNDVFFSLHAAFATSISICQCIIYERGSQTVSITTRVIILVYFIIAVGTANFAYVGLMTWLDFLYYCSYIKLSITSIKYIPQAIMNYRRRSTVGWSITSVILDFIGGMCSMLQMIINCYNYDDWGSIFGDPTKFGLGIVSVAFDMIFMYQHFVLYRINYGVQIEDIRDSINRSPSNVSASSNNTDSSFSSSNEQTPVLKSPSKFNKNSASE